MEQEPVPGKDHDADRVADLEPRPFPKVGDVVRYEGKWENEVSFGEVRQHPEIIRSRDEPHLAVSTFFFERRRHEPHVQACLL